MQETQEMQVQSLVGKIPWSREWQVTLVFLPHSETLRMRLHARGVPEASDMSRSCTHYVEGPSHFSSFAFITPSQLTLSLFFLFFFSLIFIGAFLLYNAVLISVVQQSESDIYIYIYIYIPSFLDSLSI